MAPPLTAAKEASLITRLPVGRRTEVLNKISRNANAPGGCKRQCLAGSIQPNGRAQQAALQRLAGTMGIYAVETNPTGPLAVSVGGAIPASVTVESGTPASANVVAGTPPAPPPLIPTTWAGAGTYSLTEQVSNTLAGNAKLVVA
jgi:hypothetical protein